MILHGKGFGRQARLDVYCLGGIITSPSGPITGVMLKQANVIAMCSQSEFSAIKRPVVNKVSISLTESGKQDTGADSSALIGWMRSFKFMINTHPSKCDGVRVSGTTIFDIGNAKKSFRAKLHGVGVH